MPRSTILLLALASGLAACAKSSGPTTAPDQPGTAVDEPAAEPVVRNVDAKPGDVTTCPYSGRTFVVKAEHPQVEYQGQRYWICSEKAAESVRADPDRYLADFDG